MRNIVVLIIMIGTCALFFRALNAEAIQTKRVNYDLWAEVLQKYVDEEGRVNYKALKRDQKDLNAFIEHVENKQSVLDETMRVLKPEGLLCLTFDICEASLGMTFPEWNGRAVDLATFDHLIWNRADLQPLDPLATWNLEDMAAFREWNLQSAPHHNYVVGGAVFRKKKEDSRGGR